MSRPASTSDDNPEPSIFGLLRIADHISWRAVRTYDLDLVRYFQLGQDLRRGLHGGQIRITAHDDAHCRFHKGVSINCRI